jgi:hypothetical protein
MPVNWINNSNDDLQSTTVITAKVDGEQTSGTTLNVDNFTQYDSDGGLNWRAGDEFTITNVAADDDDQLYSIVSITAGSGSGTAKNWAWVITPTLGETADDNGTVTKEDSYKGNHGSAENHLRLRSLGII